MHQHSGFSDGFPTSIPADYFRQARDRGLRFNSSAEHSDFLFLPLLPLLECLIPTDPTLIACLGDRISEPDRISLLKWRDTLVQARGESRDEFVGIRGFEWTNPRHGHINVYFSENYISVFIGVGILTMDAFWSWFTRPTNMFGGADGLGSFNHPGREDSLAGFDPGFTWNDMAYVAEAADRMIGIELFNRSGRRGFEEFYFRALDNGWHLAPIGSEDHHDLEWGALNLAKTSIITDDLSEEGLKTAMKDRRVYALLENSAQSWADFACLHFDADGEPMGSILLRAPGDTVRLRASATLRDSNGDCNSQPYPGQLELVTSGAIDGIVVATADSRQGRLEHSVDAGEKRVGPNQQAWYLLRLFNDAGETTAYSAPIWIGESRAPRQ